MRSGGFDTTAPAVAALIMTALVAACSTPAQQLEAAKTIGVRDDEFRPYREYISGEIRAANQLGVGGKQLIARIDRKTGITTTLLNFQIAYHAFSRRNYEIARNNRAEQLKMTVLERSGASCQRRETRCAFMETVSVELPEIELRQAAPPGYQIKLFPRIGPEALITVPRELIDSLYAKIEADKQRPPPAATSTVASPRQ